MISVCLQNTHVSKTGQNLLKCYWFFKFTVTHRSLMQNGLFHPIFMFKSMIQICPDCFYEVNKQAYTHKCPRLHTNMELHRKNQKVRLDPRENMSDKTCTKNCVFPENTLKKSRKIFASFDFLPALRICNVSKI